MMHCLLSRHTSIAYMASDLNLVCDHYNYHYQERKISETATAKAPAANAMTTKIATATTDSGNE